MCEIADALFVMAQDAEGEYRRAVHLRCCACGASNPIERVNSPLCSTCYSPLHFPVIPKCITVCGRCNLSIRGVLPKPMCIACQSITNHNGYNEKLLERINGKG